MGYKYLKAGKSKTTDLNLVLSHLSKGDLVIAHMGPGHFTSGGHYMVLGDNRDASFDARCLPELHEYYWHDILKMAAYKQHNPAIPASAQCCGTGRLKSGYKVQDILCMFGEDDYTELHNALTDAMDELRIMNYLKHSIKNYPRL